MAEWIKIADQLPELDQLVWLWDGEMVWVGGRSESEDDGWLWGNSYATFWWDGKKWDGDLEIDDDYAPTHWIPLPEPPKE